MANLEQSFDKAFETKVAEGQAGRPHPQQGQDEKAPEVTNQPVGQAEVSTTEAPKKEAPEKGQAEREWDGKSETLVNELKQDPKSIQRAYTKKAMALAEAEKRLKELDGLDKAEVEAYRQWKQQQEVARQQQLVQAPPAPTQLTPEQFEYIKQNPEAMQQYIQSLVNVQLQQAGQYVGQELANIKYQQSLAQWEQTIADFGEIHPDMWEMHQAGLFKPILEQVVKAGGTLEDAYNEASKIRDAFQVKADVQAQKGVAAKREASSLPGVTSSSDDTVFVENRKDALDAAFDLAFTKKEYVDKTATVSPRGRVKVKNK